MNKKETLAYWKDKIQTRPGWALRAAVRIYQQQTDLEKTQSHTQESNGVGFNSFDAPVITPIVQEYLRSRRFGIESQRILMRRMPKYANQLYKLVEK